VVHTLGEGMRPHATEIDYNNIYTSILWVKYNYIETYLFCTCIQGEMSFTSVKRLTQKYFSSYVLVDFQACKLVNLPINYNFMNFSKYKAKIADGLVTLVCICLSFSHFFTNNWEDTSPHMQFKIIIYG